jgi:simple sugar transport system permease protein
MTATAEAPERPSSRRPLIDLNAYRRLPLLPRAGLFAIAVMFVLSLVRVLSGANDLTSTGTFGAALRLAMPIGLAGLGGLWSERAGVVNIGLEGMMIFGTWFGAWAGFRYGPWWGVALGAAGGAAGGLIHALATVTFGVDHIISGVAINILGAGTARYLSVVTYGNGAGSGGSATQSPRITGRIGTFTLPVLSGGKIFGWKSPDVFGDIGRHSWFLISDIADFLKAMTAGVSLVVVFAVVLFPLTYLVLWKTAFGLRLRFCGEDPVAAESLGVRVYRMKYAAVIVSGALAGLGGAVLVLVFSGSYIEGQTGGRGFIGLAAMIFGNWMPGGLAVGAGLFGFADALQLRNAAAVHALLLFIAIVLGVIGLRSLVSKKIVGALITLGFAAALAVWYLASDTVPREFVGFTPHLITLLVLALAAQRLRPPAADGKPYRKGQAR